MPLLKIYQDSRRRGTCRSCRAAIEWAELVSGKQHPFDAPIRPLPDLPIESGGRVIVTVDTSVSPTHFATCPQGKQWTKRNRR